MGYDCRIHRPAFRAGDQAYLFIQSNLLPVRFKLDLLPGLKFKVYYDKIRTGLSRHYKYTDLYVFVKR